MFRISNNLVGILNFVTFLLSIPILWTGIWLSKQASSDCEKFFEKPIIALGIFLMAVSIAGLIGACCGISWLLWCYLLVMFLLIILLFCLTIFAFVVTNQGAGKVLSNRGYKEYRLGDYSNWLQKRVNNNKNWNKIKSCIIDSAICPALAVKTTGATIETFYNEHLTALQSGCCKPSDECGFTYVNATFWNPPAGATTYNSTDCTLWSNDPKVLCYNCQSCKAGLLQNIKTNWKKVAVINIIFLVFLVIVYSIGCCAFRNNREDSFWKRRSYP